jgi:hypothetical protein
VTFRDGHSEELADTNLSIDAIAATFDDRIRAVEVKRGTIAIALALVERRSSITAREHDRLLRTLGFRPLPRAC